MAASWYYVENNESMGTVKEKDLIKLITEKNLVDESFVIDVSRVYERKRQALACHRSQFEPSGNEVVDT